MPRDIDHIIDRLKAEFPGLQVTESQVTNPRPDDKSVWLIKIPDRDGELRMESSHGNCPFIIETDLGGDRSCGRSINEAAQKVRGLYAREILRREFLQCEYEAAKGTFLLQLRSKCEWDWNAFRRLTSAMYDVAEEIKGNQSLERWVAEGFWYCDWFITETASHSNFSRFPEPAYRDAVELIHNLASLLFSGQNPYRDDTLRKKAKGEPHPAANQTPSVQKPN
jgi:hypothetical protein